MFYLTRRQTGAAMSAAAGAAVYLAASEIGARKLKLTGLFVLASVSMAGMATARTSAKAYSVEKRFNHLLTNGGTFGGDVAVIGNLHGTGGVLTVGDQLNVQGNTLTHAQDIARDPGSGSANVNITGGGIGIAGNFNMNNNNIVNGGVFNGACTGDTQLGSAPGSYTQNSLQAVINRVNDILTVIG